MSKHTSAFLDSLRDKLHGQRWTLTRAESMSLLEAYDALLAAYHETAGLRGAHDAELPEHGALTSALLDRVVREGIPLNQGLWAIPIALRDAIYDWRSQHV